MIRSSARGRLRPAFVLLPLALAPAAPAAAELTHRYSFNDGTANDSVATAHGVIVNNAPVSGGRINFAANTGLTFQPITTAQYVDLPNQIARTPALTLETWATYRGGIGFQEIATFGTGEAGEVQPGANPPNGFIGIEYVALIPASFNGTVWGTIRRNVPPSNAPLEQQVASPAPLTTNREYHLVYTVDFPAGAAALFIDGAEVGRRSITIDPSLHDQVNNWLGRSQWSADPFFNGSISEFRIYDQALSAAEVAANFVAGPDVIVPEPSAAGVVTVAVAGLFLRRTRRR